MRGAFFRYVSALLKHLSYRLESSCKWSHTGETSVFPNCLLGSVFTRTYCQNCFLVLQERTYSGVVLSSSGVPLLWQQCFMWCSTLVTWGKFTLWSLYLLASNIRAQSSCSSACIRSHTKQYNHGKPKVVTIKKEAVCIKYLSMLR